MAKNKDYRLGELLVLLPGQASWTIDDAKKLFELVRLHGRDYEAIARKMNKKASTIQILLQELKRAAKTGYSSIDEYFEKGRPCRYGKQEAK